MAPDDAVKLIIVECQGNHLQKRSQNAVELDYGCHCLLLNGGCVG